MEVVAMARDGRIRAETPESPLGRAAEVYEKLRAGQTAGRAVLVFEGGLALRPEFRRDAFAAGLAARGLVIILPP